MQKKSKAGKMAFAEGHAPKVGKSNFANLPSEVVMKEYPKPSHVRPGSIDDTITGIDDVVRHGEGKISKYLSNQK